MENINQISILDKNISSQIAAGEVVQRPASIVKELMENSIDALSQNITLIIKDAGKTLIKIKDDGKGMSAKDAKLCFEQHATSKIKKENDLYNIKTLGFRGEALYSIATVAHIEMITSLKDNSLGTQLKLEGNKLISEISVVSKKGTIISVKNIFFNIPARRKFLKSDKIELSHIYEEFIKIAISYPNISFKLINNDKTIYSLESSKLLNRIISLFGKEFQKNLLPCKEKTENFRIKGYIGKPEKARKTRGNQYIFVNGRYIKSPYLHSAIKKGFEGLIPLGYNPIYVLFIELDPTKIDVNVHPQKHEIKFEEDFLIYSMLKSIIEKTIASHNLVPSIDFSTDINSSTAKLIDYSTPKSKSTIDYNSYAKLKNYDKIKVGEWKQLYGNINNTHISENKPQKRNILNIESNIDKIKINDLAELSTTNTLQIFNKYILVQTKNSLLVIDQKKAYERIVFEQTKKDLKKINHIKSQNLLFPIKISLLKNKIILLSEFKLDLNTIGFHINFHDEFLDLLAIPVHLQSSIINEFFEKLIIEIEQNNFITKSIEEKNELYAKKIAFYSSKTFSKKLSKTEQTKLIDNLFSCRISKYTPSKKLIFNKIDLQYFDSLFC